MKFMLTIFAFLISTGVLLAQNFIPVEAGKGYFETPTGWINWHTDNQGHLNGYVYGLLQAKDKWPLDSKLGYIKIGDSEFPDKEKSRMENMTNATGDWVYESEGNTLRLSISRLIPALKIETDSPSLTLFDNLPCTTMDLDRWAGMKTWKKPLVDWEKLQNLLADNRAELGKEGHFLPRKVAFETKDGVQTKELNGETDLSEMSNGWMLFWFDGLFAQEFMPAGYRHYDGPIEKYYQADRPILLVFSKAPEKLNHSSNGIRFALNGKTTVMALPFYGNRFVFAEDTKNWNDKLPEEVLRNCILLNSLLLNPVTAYSESFFIPEDSDDVLIRNEYTHELIENDWGVKEVKWAPIPPVLTLANLSGAYPCEIKTKRIFKTPVATTLGPYEVLGETNELEYIIPGVQKYVYEQLETVPSDGKEVRQLRQRLDREILKMIEQDTLAPEYGKYTEGGGRTFFETPAENVYLLSEALQQTSEEVRKKAESYLTEMVKNTRFATSSRGLQIDEGVRREFHPLNVKQMIGSRGPYRSSWYKKAMALWEYSKAVGNLPRFGYGPRYALNDMDWALMTQGYGYRDRYFTRNTNDPNMVLSGLASFARMMRQKGMEKEEKQAVYLFAKNAVSRMTMFEAMGRYAIHGRLDAGKPGALHNHYENFLPVYILTFLTELGPEINRAHGGEQAYTAWNIMPSVGKMYREVPESNQVTQLFKDMLGYTLGWWVADGPEWFHSSEKSRELKDVAWALFLAESYVLDAPFETLAKHVDVPTTRFGDLYYMHKLAIAIELSGKKNWVDLRKTGEISE